MSKNPIKLSATLLGMALVAFHFLLKIKILQM